MDIHYAEGSARPDSRRAAVGRQCGDRMSTVCSWQMGECSGPLGYDCPDDAVLFAPQGHHRAGDGFCKKHAVILGFGDSIPTGFQWRLPNGEKYYYNEPS